MIQLTRLNGHSMAMNCDLIKFVEQAPDTVITLITGEKVVVKESTTDVIARILEFRRAILSATTANPLSLSGSSSSQDPSK